MEEVPQPALFRLGLEFFDDRRIEMRITGFGHLPGVDLLRRIHVPRHEIEKAISVFEASVGVGEIHVMSPVSSERCLGQT